MRPLGLYCCARLLIVAAVVGFIQGQNNAGGTPSGAASNTVGSGGAGCTLLTGT